MSQPPPYPGTDKAGPPPNPVYPQQQGYNTQYGMQAPYPAAYPGQQYPPHSVYPTPPPAGYQSGPYQSPQTVVVVQPQQFREQPVHTRCPHCQADIVTGVDYETGTLTWIACAVLCIVGCDAGCCLIPFCCDACKDVVHTCPSCKQVLYRWNRL